MTKHIGAAISEARWKVRNRRKNQMIVRYKHSNGNCRYMSTTTLTGMMQRTRVGESPLLILEVLEDGRLWSRCKEFDSADLEKLSTTPEKAQQHIDKLRKRIK